jgi:Protein of unknown function (DUF2934)
MPVRKRSTDKPKPEPRRRTSRTKRAVEVDHATIAERAYFIHVEEGSHDELGNWLRAERELAVA